MLTLKDFEAKVPAVGVDPALSKACRDALLDHYVNGWSIVEVLSRHNIGQPRFYSAVERYKLPRTPKLGSDGLSRIVTIVPDEYAARLRYLIAQQVAIWLKEKK